MTFRSPIAKQLKRDVLLALAMLAVTLKILVPAGFMPDVQPHNGLPFALVLCTGEGAKVVRPGEALGQRQGENHDGKSVHDAPCPFAAHAAGAPPPSLVVTTGAGAVRYVSSLPRRPRRSHPGAASPRRLRPPRVRLSS